MLLPSNHFILIASESVKTICRPLLKWGIDQFCYTRSYLNGKRIYLCTNSQWIHTYFGESLYQTGSCELRPNVYKPQILLWSSLPNKILYQTARNLNIKEGIFTVHPHEEYTEFIDFLTSDANVNLANIFFNNQDILMLFIDYFLEQAKPLIKQAIADNLILPHFKLPTQFIKNCESKKALRPIPLKLTARQQQCLLHLIQGETYKEIARKLSLSPRTVETYIHNLSAKFKVDNTIQLILTVGQQFLQQTHNKLILEKFIHS